MCTSEWTTSQEGAVINVTGFARRQKALLESMLFAVMPEVSILAGSLLRVFLKSIHELEMGVDKAEWYLGWHL